MFVACTRLFLPTVFLRGEALAECCPMALLFPVCLRANASQRISVGSAWTSLQLPHCSVSDLEKVRFGSLFCDATRHGCRNLWEMFWSSCHDLSIERMTDASTRFFQWHSAPLVAAQVLHGLCSVGLALSTTASVTPGRFAWGHVCSRQKRSQNCPWNSFVACTNCTRHVG